MSIRPEVFGLVSLLMTTALTLQGIQGYAIIHSWCGFYTRDSMSHYFLALMYDFLQNIGSWFRLLHVASLVGLEPTIP